MKIASSDVIRVTPEHLFSIISDISTEGSRATAKPELGDSKRVGWGQRGS